MGTGAIRATQATMTTAAAPGETKGRAAPGRATQDSAPASNSKAGTKRAAVTWHTSCHCSHQTTTC